MDVGLLVGLAIGAVALVGSVLLDGGELRAFVNLPALLIVLGGTVGASMVTTSLKDTLRLPAFVKKALFPGASLQPAAVIATLVDFAQTARKEGVLALQYKVSADRVDPFLAKGLELVIDGADEVLVREIMESEIRSMKRRHDKGIGIFEVMGGYAPTMGIIGTVMGLVHVLSRLGGDETGGVGQGIAVAFLATFYGIFSANLLFLPLSGNLKAKSEDEAYLRQVMIEGVLGIQAGFNPHLLEQKLWSHFSNQAPER